MRRARAGDYWRTVYERSYTENLQMVSLNGLNGLHDIDITNNGIYAICGLNGAGKSTIVSAIKAIIGLPLSDLDKRKLGDQIVSGTADMLGETVSCDNRAGETLLAKGWDVKVRYLDCLISTRMQQYFISQTNLDELVEQFEEVELQKDDLNEIGFLVGKEYDSCSVWVMEDVDGEESEFLYFLVKSGGAEYSSIQMGNGEHFLLYLFWYIAKADKDSLIIIEEPETYISILSQNCFADFLAKYAATKGIKVILTTHSPYILNRIKNEDIRIVSRINNATSIMPPSELVNPNMLLGIDPIKKGTIFVEDRIAKQLLLAILEDKAPHLLRQFNIEAVGGEAAITERLRFPKMEKTEYCFIGAYDGDMRETLDAQHLQWKYCFLPGMIPVEEQIKQSFRQYDNLKRIAKLLSVNTDELFAIVSKYDGMDHHDWFEEIRKSLSIDGERIVSAFYYAFLKDNESVDTFVEELQDGL